jgi:parallel beta-helix repeat protein
MGVRRFVTASIAVAGLVALAIAVPTAAYAASTLRVGPGEQYSSIQAAVNAAHNGDTVSVDAGTYPGNILINGKYISLVTTAGATIQATSTGSAPVFIANVPFAPGVSMTLSGFTITAGNSPSGQGGGLTIAGNASPIITGNTITGNHAAGYGGGISISSNSNPIIKGNTVTNNSSVQGGGGIFANTGSSPSIYGNTITNNTTSGASISGGGSSGGGIYVEGTSSTEIFPVIINNTIKNNTADFAGGGIMVRTGADAVIESNDIESNTAAYGGGIHLEAATQETVNSNQIKNNVARYNSSFAGSGFGAGIAVFDSTTAQIQFNTIQGNQASNGGGGVSVAESSSIQLNGNLISGNSTSYPLGASEYGGGVYVANGTLTAYNNQLVNNSAGLGGGIALITNAKGTIYNNTIVSNSEPVDHGGAIFVVNTAGMSAVNNILTANQGYQIFEQKVGDVINNNLITLPGSASASGSGTYYNSAGGGGLSGSNISPGSVGFTNAAAGDYSITSASPAVGAGTSSGIPALGTDYRNVIRTVNALDIGAFAYSANPVTTQPVYRIYSSTSQDHFLTIDVNERNQVEQSYNPAEWRYEGIAFDAFTTQVSGTVPLYRFFSPTYQGHFYTANPDEWNYVKSSYPANIWTYEMIAFYVYPLNTQIQSRPVYRFWSPAVKQHFYTADPNESSTMQRIFPSSIWTFEGANFNIPD